MTRFVPPKPETVPVGSSFVDRVRKSLGSSLAMFQAGSYTSVGLSRFPIITLPRLRRRWVYTARDPELVRDMLVTRPTDFPKSVLMGGMLRCLTGDSIFTSNGDTWKRQRRIIDPSLEQARVRDSFERMRDAADGALAQLDREAAKPGPVRIDPLMTFFAADVIFRTIFSEPLTAEPARRAFSAFETFQNLAYAHGIVSLTGFPVLLLPSTLRRFVAAWRVRRVMKAPLERRLKQVRFGATHPRTDILAKLLATRDPETDTAFTDRELLDQISMLFLAGHETSASAIAWALYLMAACPHFQSRARDEVAAVAGDGPLQFEHIKRLSFVRDVFREGMRLYPPVTFVARDTTRSETLCRRDVPEGGVIFIAPWLLHRHAAFWEDPDAFDPERFETEAGRAASRCAYMPFSMGARVCPGAAFALQEATLVLAMIVRRYELGLTDGPPPEPVAKLTLRSANGITLTVRRRDAASAPQ